MALTEEVLAGPAALALLDGELGELAAPSPFLTRPWLRAWWDAYGHGEPLAVAVRRDGRLAAGAFARRARGVVTSATNDHSGDWDVLGDDPQARDRAWRALAGAGRLRLRAAALPEWTGAADAAARVLRGSRFFVARERGPLSPYLPLPESGDALLAAASRNLRSQVGRRRRALEQEGVLELRTSATEADFDAFLAVETSGWKGATAIGNDARAERLYRAFLRDGAAAGIARLRLLCVDGVVIAGDLEAVAGDTAFLIKTGYDENWGKLSPGLVLRAEVLRAAVDEGRRGYDFLGGPDPYKLRWTDRTRARVTLSASRDPAGYLYRARVRPALKALRARARRG